MKKAPYILALVVVLLLVLIGVLGYRYIQSGVPSTPPAHVEESLATRTEETDSLSLNVTYPTISEITQKAAQANQEMKAGIDARIESFKKDALESWGMSIDLPKDIKSTVTGSPSIEENNERYVAIFMGMEWYLRGSAHPSHSIDTYIYDYKEGKLIAVSALFKDGSQYLSLLSKLSRDDLMAQAKEGDTGFMYDREMVELGTEPAVENFARVLPLKDGLVIYFDEYQVAPYAAGPQQVVIPYAKLQAVINPDGVLGVYIK